LGCFGFVAYALPYYLILYGLLLFAKRQLISAGVPFFSVLIFLMGTLLNSTRYLGDGSAFSLSLQFLKEAFRLGTERSPRPLRHDAGYFLVKS
jgi:hypothetical protein